MVQAHRPHAYVEEIHHAGGFVEIKHMRVMPSKRADCAIASHR